MSSLHGAVTSEDGNIVAVLIREQLILCVVDAECAASSNIPRAGARGTEGLDGCVSLAWLGGG